MYHVYYVYIFLLFLASHEMNVYEQKWMVRQVAHKEKFAFYDSLARSLKPFENEARIANM